MDQAYHALRDDGATAGPAAQAGPETMSVQDDRLAHQGIVRPQEVVDFFHRRLAGDQVVHVAAERLGQLAADEGFAATGLVDDFIAAEAQGFEIVIDTKLDDAVLLTVVDHVHHELLDQIGANGPPGCCCSRAVH